MNLKYLALGACALSASLIAEENIPIHCFSPKVFYRHHREQNYTYNTGGIGLHYHLHRPVGINVKLSFITNPQDENVLSEAENHLFYKFLYRDGISLYPVLSHRFSTHSVGKKENKISYINKQTFYAGMGLALLSEDGYNMHFELQGFRDLFNAKIIKEENEYHGKSYSNPQGARVKLGFSAETGQKSYLQMEMYFGRTFPKCYQELGGEISFNYGF